ncbi:MAG: nitroreductase family protein [Myxococcales bacterium]|nr:nitroreductase family protein [Myxococcales bacterium]MCB9703110.1 nitroreductase family protein [Myxococcales bacterium]
MENPANTDLPIHELLRRRYSPRAFAPRAVDEGALTLLFEAARWAASCMNEQPWRFIVATQEEPEAHARLASCLVEGNRRWASAAPVLVLGLGVETFARNGKANPHTWHDLGLALGNLSLQATALGLAVHMMAGVERERAREVYAIPEGVSVITAIAIGYPGDPALLPEDLEARERAPRVRRPLDEVVFGERFGEPRSRR